MYDDYFIRDYTDEDYEQVSSLWKETSLGGEDRGDNAEVIRECIRIGGKLLVLIEKLPGRLIGTSWMTYDGRRIHLHHFAISPSAQGKGLAHLLVRESLHFARIKGKQIKLEVHHSNKKAINLYKNSGFTFLGDYDVYIIRNLNEIPA